MDESEFSFDLTRHGLEDNDGLVELDQEDGLIQGLELNNKKSMSDNLATGPKRDIELVKNVTTKDTNSDIAKSDIDTSKSDLKPDNETVPNELNENANSNDDSIEIEPTSRDDKRHYKKDSRYLEDLYTLTFQEDDSMDFSGQMTPLEVMLTPSDGSPLPPDSDEALDDSLRLSSSPGESLRLAELRLMSLQPSFGHEYVAETGPKSLSFLAVRPKSQNDQVKTSPQKVKGSAHTALETNLHKILARRIQEGRTVSYETTKLLTKAYYTMLKNSPITPAGQDTKLSKSKQDPKLKWETLLQTDINQLKNIIGGYRELCGNLSDELLLELQIKDDLQSEQDAKLEYISDFITNIVM